MDTLPKGNRGAAIASSDGPSPGRGPAIAVLIAAAIAIAAASYLLHAYLRKTYGAEVFDSVCSINETFDCDKISTSSWGKLFDTPITVFAIPTWLALAALAILSLGRSAHAVGALQVLRLGAALALAYGLLLFYVIVAIERTLGIPDLHRIADGDDFAALARAHSDDKGSALKGGSLDWVGPGDLVKPFEEAMMKLGINEVSEPIQTQFGWHIIQVLGRENKDDSSEFKKNLVRDAIRKRKIEEETELWVRRLRDEAFVEIYQDRL